MTRIKRINADFVELVVSPLCIDNCNGDKMNRQAAKNAKISLFFSVFLAILASWR